MLGPPQPHGDPIIRNPPPPQNPFGPRCWGFSALTAEVNSPRPPSHPPGFIYVASPPPRQLSEPPPQCWEHPYPNRNPNIEPPPPWGHPSVEDPPISFPIGDLHLLSSPPPIPFFLHWGPQYRDLPPPMTPPPSIPAPVPLGDAMGRGCGLFPFAGAGGGLGNIPPPGGVGGGAIQSLGCLRKGRGFLDGRGHGVGVAVRAWSVGGGAYGVGQLFFLLLFLLSSGTSILPQVTAQRPPHLGAQRLQGLQPGLQQWGGGGKKGSPGLEVGGGGSSIPPSPPPSPQHTTPAWGPPPAGHARCWGWRWGPASRAPSAAGTCGNSPG